MVAANAKTGKVTFVDFGPVGRPGSIPRAIRWPRNCRRIDLRLARGPRRAQ